MLFGVFVGNPRKGSKEVNLYFKQYTATSLDWSSLLPLHAAKLILHHTCALPYVFVCLLRDMVRILCFGLALLSCFQPCMILH